MTDPAIRYDATTDTLLIQLRPWPAPAPTHDFAAVGGEDAGDDLVIRYGPDGEPFAWEIERASEHPEHIAAALRARRVALLGPAAAA